MGAFLAALPRVASVAMSIGRVASFAQGMGSGRDAGTDQQKDPALFYGNSPEMKTVY